MPALEDFSKRRLQAGRVLATPVPGDEIVISGMSGRFPNSDDVQEFMDNLMNGVDLCDADDRRWAPSHPEIPQVSGKMNKVEKFDNGHFGVPSLQANAMDPVVRMSMERSFEAIMDAGMHPNELEGTRTGVFLGSCFSESEKHHFFDRLNKNAQAIIGCTRSMQANRVSYYFKLNGPSFICDTACSSGLYAFEEAYRSIREGNCDRAIVGANNLIFDPLLTLQFARLGVLNMNTGSRPFDANATGYTRSEGNVFLILQKKKEAKRIYAEVIHSKVNVDGFKEQGISYPSGDAQLLLLKDVYEECNVEPSSLAFVEAHGTGTKVGDPEELNAIDAFFCSGKDKSLLIGSVKGNIGHTEPVSGICSIIKVIYGMETGYIPPNIHYETPRPDVPGLLEKRLKVITERTKWPEHSSIAGINCFGFGGANAHVVLKRNEQKKIYNYDNVPRLVCFSGRTTGCIESIQDFLKSSKLDYEFVRLIQEIYRNNIPNNRYRGYSLVSPKGELRRSSSFYNGNQPKLYLCIGSSNKNYNNVMNELLQFSIFQDTVDQVKSVLTTHNLNNIDLSVDQPANVLQQVVISICVHLGIINILKKLNISLNHIRGSSIGEFSACYANGSLSLEEVVLATYSISKIFLEATRADTDVHTKLIQKLALVIKPKDRKVNKMDLSKSNTFAYCSPEYFVYNIFNPKLSDELRGNFESDARILSIDFETKCDKVELVTDQTNSTEFLNNIGRLYEAGYEMHLHKLFKEIKFPVSRGTPMFSPLIKWDHKKNFYVPKQTDQSILYGQSDNNINVLESDMSFYKGHVIDGRILFPATGYLYNVWELYAQLTDRPTQNIRVCFEDVRFHTASTFTKDTLGLNIFLALSGDFSISESNTSTLLVTGRLTELSEPFENEWFDCGSNYENSPILNEKDVYKELRLRGYNYKGAFRSIKECQGNRGLIEWNNNWITFLDNMMQLYLLQQDSKSLYVPTGIGRLVIDTIGHQEYINSLGDEKYVAATVNQNCNLISTKFIQFHQLRANMITRKRQILQPILEAYKFCPNSLQTTVEESVRINVQLMLENKIAVNLKVLEEVINNTDKPMLLAPYIQKAMGDLPLIQPNITVITDTNLEVELKGIKVEDKNYKDEGHNILYVSSNLLHDDKILQQVSRNITEDGFVITIESNKYNSKLEGFQILTTHVVADKVIYLLRKTNKKSRPVTIDITDLDNLENWLPKLQLQVKTASSLVLYSQNNPTNGILGLVNCILREVPASSNVQGFFMQDKAPGFDCNAPFYKEQLEKGMTINVFQNNCWGTYRHTLLTDAQLIKSEHCYANTLAFGDLTSLTWVQGKLTKENATKELIHIYYSAINFRDVMTASGKIPVDAITLNRREQECIQGFEFSGRNVNGERVIGFVTGGATASIIEADSKMLWKVPTNWTLEEAATVPVVYCTVLYAFMSIAQRNYKTILIHSGTGGIGQAAINIYTHYNYTIFVTVGTQEKKDFLLKHCPQIKESHIGNSRDTSFEQMIFKETNGRGVDVVLNSLAEEKLEASVRCLARHGTFFEIGKFDLSKNNKLCMDLTSKGATFHGIMLDTLLKSNHKITGRLYDVLCEGMENGFVKPLPSTCFNMDQLEESYRFMSTGKHIGKILIKIREEEKEMVVKPRFEKFTSVPRFYCKPNASYIILGGLGGFGLELADWLVMRGAQVVVLSSRTGVKTGYEQFKINTWKSYGVKIIISTEDISTYDGCQNLIKNSNKIAPVAAVFNLAVVLKDTLLENQTVDNFKTSFSPKAIATIHLDDITKKLCERLEHFVVFSSVSCGRGNAGQTNYGMSNSIMERICEQRKKDGYPALAIQWGAIGDVGLVAEMQKDQTEIAIGGTLQQRITSCLEAMDTFLQQNETIVSSIIVAEKAGMSSENNMIDAVMNLLGLKDIKTISPHSTLSELGMDSMMAVEIKQTLERDYDIFMSAQEMRKLTFAKLFEYNNAESGGSKNQVNDVLESLKKFVRSVFDEETYNLHLVELSSSVSKDRKIVVFPGIEGTYGGLKTFCESLGLPCGCVQYKYSESVQCVSDMVDTVMPHVKAYLGKNREFTFIGHSFGSILSIEIASRLEIEGYVGKMVFIDGSPALMQSLLSMFNNYDANEFETVLIGHLMAMFVPQEQIIELQVKLLAAASAEERQQIALDKFADNATVPTQYLKDIFLGIFQRMRVIGTYKPELKKLQANVILYKPTVATANDVGDDLRLSEFFENPISSTTYDGDHTTIIENLEMQANLKQFLQL